MSEIKAFAPHAELERRKKEAKRLADKYIGEDGGPPKALEELAAMSRAEYSMQRARLAEKFGIPLKFLDEEFRERKRGGGHTVERTHWNVDPWPSEVSGAELIEQMVRRIKRHVVLDNEAALTAALWTMVSWMHAAAVHSPILMVSSPEADCGKTTSSVLWSPAVTSSWMLAPRCCIALRTLAPDANSR
jgi:hypothetical protein